MIAAVAWRPDLAKKEGKIHLSLLNFLMLLGWWIFLYAFIVFPHQYVVAECPPLQPLLRPSLSAQNALLLAVLGLAAWTVRADGGGSICTFSVSACSTASDRSCSTGRRESVARTTRAASTTFPSSARVAWMAAAALSAREWDLQSRRVHPAPTLVEEGCSPARHAGAALAAGLGRVDRAGRQLACSLARVPRFHRAGRHAGAGRVRLPPPVLPGPGADVHCCRNRAAATKARSVCRASSCRKKSWLPSAIWWPEPRMRSTIPWTAIMSYSEQLWAKERLTDEQNATGPQDCEPGPAHPRSGRRLAELCPAVAGRKNSGRPQQCCCSARPRCWNCGTPAARSAWSCPSRRIFPRCRATPTNSFRPSSRSSKMPWTPWKKLAEAPRNHRPPPGR